MIFLVIVLCIFTASQPLRAPIIDIDALSMAESRNKNVCNPIACGRWQITAPALADYNLHHQTGYTLAQVGDVALGRKIATWYANEKIPQYLKHYGIPDTLLNRIFCWNAGIGYVASHKPMPTETKQLAKRYLIFVLQ